MTGKSTAPLPTTDAPMTFVPRKQPPPLRETTLTEGALYRVKHHARLYAALSKPQLSLFVVMTAGLGFVMVPLNHARAAIAGAETPLALPAVSRAVETVLVHLPGVSSTTSASLSTVLSDAAMAVPAYLPGYGALLAVTVVGTSLCVMSANMLNQWSEWPFDAQMRRTRNRVLVRYGLSPGHVFAAATTIGAAGTALLWTAVNPVAAALGAGNIVLYAFVYTPLKRLSIANTWVGAVVGGVPPLIGWAAATGGSLLAFPADLGAWLLAFCVYAWQFPHFNALSWNLQAEYAQSGYRMMASLRPELCTRTALQYALLLVPACSIAAPLCGLVTPLFALSSLVPNVLLVVRAAAFRRAPSSGRARQLFFASLLHLPLLCVLLLIHRPNGDAPGGDTRAPLSGVGAVWCAYEWVKRGLGAILGLSVSALDTAGFLSG